MQHLELFCHRSAILLDALYDLLALKPVPAIQNPVVDRYFKRFGLFEAGKIITIQDIQGFIPVNHVRMAVFFIAPQSPDQHKQLCLLQAQFLIKIP